MTLITKYRPKKLKQVVGQPAAVRAIKGTLESGKSRSYLFTGASGTGKTTLARIIASMVDADVVEVDAATRTGVDDVREIQQYARHRPIGKPNRVIIVDECHMLSRAAWNALLKQVEEPPKHLVWCLCTTEESKVPKTIQTRCTTIKLNSVPDAELVQLVTKVAAKEGVDLDGAIADEVATHAHGSPREALSALGLVLDCKSVEEAEEALSSVHSESKEVIDLCRALMAGPKNRAAAWSCVASIPRNGVEGARIVICSYFTKVVKSPQGKYFVWAMDVLNSFADPYPDHGLHHIYLSLDDLYSRK